MVNPLLNKRLLTLGVALGVAWLISAARVFQIQVLKSSYYGGMAINQSLRRDILPPKRGEIFDRGGVCLVANVDKGAGIPEHFRWSRLTPNGEMAGQVLGVVSRDGYGQSGLELHLDRDLRGTDGWSYVRHDARNRYTPGNEDQQTPPVDGLGVHLTLDTRVQSVVEHALERGVQRTGAKQGVAIVIDPSTGDILAMANYPFFDPNTRASVDGENWKNLAVSMVYEPGSAFKVMTAAALLEEHKMAPMDTVDGEGGTYKLAGHVIHDTHELHRISFTDALAYSSNICFAKMSMKLPSVDFYKYIRSFGFGMKTSVTLPAEESGRVASVETWSASTQPTMAFGHEISVTPLQMVMAAAAVANNGILMQPRMVKSWVDAEGHVVRTNEPRQIRRVISDSTAATLRTMMRSVVEYGTAAGIKHPTITIAGKTGTAEKIDPHTGKYMHGHFHSSFIGMAPADHPAFVCLVMVDEPTKLKYGSESAAPIFREILDRISGEGIAWNDHPQVWATTPAVAAVDSSAGKKSIQSASFTSPMQAMQSSSHPVVLVSDKSSAKISASKAVEVMPLISSADKALGSQMPNLRNTTLRDALLRMQEMGVEVQYHGEGKVVEQDPAPGSPMRRGSRCNLKLGWAG